ncbi:cytochrome c oxidase subunit II [Paracoccus sp. S-4012]|uniref:cytochrome c oxidase subunit II n=1 Tax=Paracoccus sp. S-4012 TaxID=2665648 RepID=UPI0012B143FF|nr:cytochrome c oxidase subunit II [Paracoccus sp. S-4012]MRX52259.1 cytochrome c oxidase subunit II [Paracoccus sp. S-4012]
MRADRRAGAAALALLLAGCDGPQSSLDPGGPAADSIHTLGTIMYVGAAAVTLLVTVLMLVPFLRRRERPVRRNLFLWGGGVVLPSVTLLFLVPYVMNVGHGMRDVAPTRVSVDVTGHMFWWDVAYRRVDGLSGPARTANEMRIPAGEPVELFLHAADVIHSFWVPSLAGKTDMIPGRVNRMVIEADQPGIYRGACAEYCGLQHSMMRVDVIAMPRAEFDAWFAGLDDPAPSPATDELRAGRDLYADLGCGACHEVRGVSQGRAGPDLTEIGVRQSIGAGALPGGVGNIAGWIASAQHIKPGNAMPSYHQLQGPQLRALAAYMESLR